MRQSYQRQLRQSDSSQLSIQMNSIRQGHRIAKKQGDKLNYVHQFDQIVSMIFRPKYCYREKGNKLCQTQRVSYNQRNTNSQKTSKPSSLEKSLSLLKKIKDYIIPEKLNFLNFKSNIHQNPSNNQTLNTSKASQLSNIDSTPKPNNTSDESDRQFINPRQLKGQPQPNDTNSQKSLPPTVKISMPRKVSKDGSQSSRKSNKNEVVQIQRGLRKSLSRNSEWSNKQTQPKPTLPQAPNPRPQHIPFKKLKYFFTLSSTNLLNESQSSVTLLLGNQNQLDCITLSRNEGIVGTELLWSLRMSKASKEKGAIDAVVVDSTKGNFVVMMSNQIGVVEVWRYGQGVGLVAVVGLEYRVKDMAMIKEGHFFILYSNGLVQIYSIQQNSLKKRYQKPLPLSMPLTKSTTTTLQPLSTSTLGSTITIYLSCPISSTMNSQLFDLYIAELSFQTETNIQLSPPRKVYSIKKQLKQQIRFDSYSRRFFLMYVGLEVFAVGKDGYMVDSAKVDVQLDGSVMSYVGRGRLLVVTQGRIEEYGFVLNEKTAPYRLEVRSLDSIILPQTINPTLFQFFQLAPIFTPLPSPKSLYTQNHFLTTYIIAYQHRHQLNKKSSTGQVPYLLTFTKFITVENKAAKLFGFEGRDLAAVEMKEIEEKVDAAKKMGLGVKEIYLELWNRTKKRTVQDFCFLLDTLDYQTISKEIQKKLKKQAMLYTQLLKIQNSCYYLLKKRVTSPQCTQTDLRNFIVSHFKIKKYFFYKDVARFCENQQAVREQLKRPQKANNDLQVSREVKQGPFSQFEEPCAKRQNAEKEEKRLMFDIQAFYTYNQMELKSYLLHLFHRYFYEIAEVSPLTKPKEGQDNGGRRDKTGNGLFWARKKDYLLKIKIMMNNFRFQLKVIYEEFLQELLKLCQKGNVLVQLLQDFEQILPTSYSRRCPSSDKTIQCQPKQQKDHEPTNELNINKRAQISRLKQSLSKSTKGQLQLQGIWRQVGPAQFTQHLYLQTVQNIYTKPIIAKLSNEVWFKRGLYSQHDFILKSRQQLEQIDAKLRSPFIFYFFIDRVYETVKDISVRDRIVKMLDQGYREVMPDHLKGRVELYYRLWLEMKLLVKEYAEVVGRQARNPTNVNVGLRSTVLGHQFMSLVNVNFGKQQQNFTSLRSKGSKAQCSSSSMKSLYQTFLPPKPGHQPTPLQSFQNFLNLPQTHLFLQFIKLQYILVGCIFHRIKPIYQQFPSGSAIFNQTINLYFQSPISQVSHLKCLLNRLNSQSKEFQQEHFELFEVLVKSVLCKVVVGDKVAEKEYVNVDQLIIYVRDVYLRNEKQLSGREDLPFRISLHDEHFPRQPQPSFSNSNTQSRISGVNLLQSSHQQSSQLLRLQPQPQPSPISTYFNMLGCVSQNKDLFRKLNIRISLYQIYQLHRQNRTQTITTLIVEYLIKEVGLYEQIEYEEFLDKTVDILVQAALILNKLFTSPATFIQQLNHQPQNHNDFPGPWSTQGFYQQVQTKQQEEGNYENELFFILVWKIMSQERFLYEGWVGQLLQNKDIVSNYLVNDMLKQNLVIFMAKYRFSIDKLFVNNIKYLQHLIQLLPEKNKIRKYFSAQIQLVKAIEPTLQPYSQPKTEQQQRSNKVRPLITNPLTENSEIISIYHIQEIFSLYPTQYLLTLDLQRICSIINEMQRILLQVAVKERLADQSGHQDKSMAQSRSRVESDHEDAFGKFQRQNSCKFIMSLEKSFCHGNQGNANNNGINANSNVNVLSNNNLNWQQVQTPVFPPNHPYSSNNQCSTPFCETPIAISNISNREIILSQLQTLIKQSAQPHTFFNETEQRLIRSFREHRSVTDKKLSSSKLLNEACSRKSLWDGDKSDRSAIIGISSLRELKNYYTSLSQLYELVVKRLINSEMIREVMPYLQKLLGLTVGQSSATSNQLYIVYPLLILNVLSKELIQENKLLLVRICSHLFREPVELLKFIRELIGHGSDMNKSYVRQMNNSGMKQSLNGFRYSMKELNQKLVEYERQTRVYRVEALDPIEHGRQAKDDTKKDAKKDTKKRLKKKLTILVDHQPSPQPSPPPSTLPLSSQPSIPHIYYMKRPFSYQNPLISQHCINSITSQQQKLFFVNQIWQLFQFQLREKELFSKDFQFMLMNVMLFQEPYTIVKYLETKLKGWYYAKKESEGGMGQGILAQSSHMLKFKPLMTYFNEMIKQSVINPLHLLEFGKRMFYMLYSTIVERSSIQYQIRQYYDIPLAQTLPCDEFPTTPFISEVYVAKFRQSIQAFAKKHKQIRKKMSSSGKFLPENNLGNPKNDGAQQKSPRKLSIIEPSPKSNLDKSKMDQSNLLEISYNNIDDEIPENLEVPLLSQNPSKISQNSKMEESFDPSRERDLVTSRGEKRFSAMLSNNNSSIILKNKLSPKSIRSSKNPSILTVSGAGIKRKNSRFFPSRKSPCQQQKRNKKTFNSMIQCKQSSDQQISYQQQSVIFQQQFQNSRQVSQSDCSGNVFVAPPRLVGHEADFMMDMSVESKGLKGEGEVSVGRNTGQVMREMGTESRELIGEMRQVTKSSLRADIAYNNQPYTVQLSNSLTEKPAKSKDPQSEEKTKQLPRQTQYKEKDGNILQKQVSMSQSKEVPSQINLSASKNIKGENLQISYQLKRGRQSIQGGIKKQEIKSQEDGGIVKFKRDRKEQGKGSRKLLTLEIPELENESDKREQVKRTDHVTNDKPIKGKQHLIEMRKPPNIQNSKQNVTHPKPNPPANLPKPSLQQQSKLRQKINQLFKKNSVQGFVLTELQDIYQKFREYCQRWDLMNSSLMQVKEAEGRNVGEDEDDGMVLQLSQSNVGQLQGEEIDPRLGEVFGVGDVYALVLLYLQQKMKLMGSSLPESEILLQELKDKLFYELCLKRLVQSYTTEDNIQAVAKIIDVAFKKKIFLTDYYYEVVSKIQVFKIEELAEKVIEQQGKRVIKEGGQQILSAQIKNNSSLTTFNRPSTLQANRSLVNGYRLPSPTSRNVILPSPKGGRGLTSPKSHVNTTPRHVQTSQLSRLQDALERQMQKVELLLQKIPLNILQFRKKELMLKLKPGKDLGRKYLLDVLVKVFQKKKDKRLAQQLYQRMKNIIDKDIK